MAKITAIDLVNYATQSWRIRRFLTWLGQGFANIRISWIKNKQITLFTKFFPIDWQEAQFTSPNDYPTFNAFFTRKLKADARPIDHTPNTLVFPVDGYVSEFGKIEKDQLLQAKGFYYGVNELIGDPELARHFHDGEFITLYLAPDNYHRVHCPFEGKISAMRYIPGRLFSVNAATTQKTPQLFTRNERVVSIFETAHGPVAVIFVGAGLVGGIHTTWAGRVCPPHGDKVQAWEYLTSEYHGINIDRGQEIGHFSIGSTVIILTPSGSLSWKKHLAPNQTVKMGEEMARWNNAFAWHYAG
jgi:phosphatidylserine decarboxylase